MFSISLAHRCKIGLKIAGIAGELRWIGAWQGVCSIDIQICHTVTDFEEATMLGFNTGETCLASREFQITRHVFRLSLSDLRIRVRNRTEGVRRNDENAIW